MPPASATGPLGQSGQVSVIIAEHRTTARHRRPARLRRPLRTGRPVGDRGSSIIELVIVMPIIIVLLFTMVALGRYSQNKILVEQAAAAAARAASLTSSPGQSQRAAQGAAAATLSGAGLACAGMTASVDTSVFRPGGQVSVTVTCTSDLSNLALTGVPGSATLHSTSVAPLEAFRAFGAGS
jgi:Flp pilus assembly protein TadG